MNDSAASLPVSSFTVSDGEGLTTAAADGDMHAFGQLYSLHIDAITRYITRRVHSPNLADDLASDTFLRALRRIHTFHWRGIDPGAWLTAIARNAITDHYRSGWTKHVTAGIELESQPDNNDHNPESVAINTIHNNSQRAAIRRALARLTVDQQRVIQLRFFDHLSTEQTAAAMARTVGAVKSMQFRALGQLRKALRDTETHGVCTDTNQIQPGSRIRLRHAPRSGTA